MSSIEDKIKASGLVKHTLWLDERAGRAFPESHRVMADVFERLISNAAQFGRQELPPARWLLLAMEELGEAVQAENDYQFREGDADLIYTEMLDTIAVLIGGAECFRRQRSTLLEILWKDDKQSDDGTGATTGNSDGSG